MAAPERLPGFTAGPASPAAHRGQDSAVQDVASISANNSPEIGKILADAFEQVGDEGVITIEEASGMETSLEVVCADMIGWVERFVEDRHLVILDFRVNVLDDRQPEAGSDATEALWVPLHDVAELDLAPGLAEFLHDHGIIATIM